MDTQHYGADIVKPDMSQFQPIADCRNPRQYERKRSKPMFGSDVTYESNDWYNQRSILGAYCGVIDTAIPGKLQHGWQWGTGVDDEGRERIRHTSIKTWVWNGRNKEKAQSVGLDVEAIGAAVLYLEDEKDFVPGLGVLAVPYHSQPPYQIHKWDDWSREAYFLAGDFKRKTVLLYYRDYQEAKPHFENYGFTVCCLGGPYAEDFLPRLRRLIRAHELVIGDRISTTAFYANVWGRPFMLHGEPLVTELTDPFEGPGADREFAKREFPHFVSGKVDSARADYELGRENMRKPGELRNMFGWRS